MYGINLIDLLCSKRALASFADEACLICKILTGRTMVRVLDVKRVQVKEILDKWDYSRLVKYVLKEHPELQEQLDELLEQYKSYLFLCAMTSNPLAVPSLAVDKIWHCHLCLNLDYNQLTKQATGKILQHQPFLEGDTPDFGSKQNLIDASFKYFDKFVFDPELLSHAGCDQCDGGGCITCHSGCK
jgi:hypothetical protein